jgi:hypothetical protein
LSNAQKAFIASGASSFNCLIFVRFSLLYISLNGTGLRVQFHEEIPQARPVALCCMAQSFDCAGQWTERGEEGMGQKRSQGRNAKRRGQDFTAAPMEMSERGEGRASSVTPFQGSEYSGPRIGTLV